MKKELNKLGIGGEMRPVHFGFATLADWCDMIKDGVIEQPNHFKDKIV